MFGIERLAEAWERHWSDGVALTAAMAEYDRLFQAELSFVDLIVAGSYRGFRDFPRMVAMTMFYFASAIWSEHQRRTSENPPRAFLCAEDPGLRASLERSFQMMDDSSVSTSELTEFVARAIAPFNIEGLCDPAKRNMYPYCVS